MSLNLFTDKMVVYFNMLDAGVKDRIVREGDGRDIVAVKFCWLCCGDVKVMKKLLKSDNICCCYYQRLIFSFVRGSDNCQLLFNAPRD